MSRQQYTTEIKIIRLMCTGRVDLSFVFRALSGGADGVFIGGCWPGECHYVTEGNFDALANLHLSRKLLQLVGLAPERVRLEWIAASEGTRFAEVMNDFVATLRELGPVGQGEGLSPAELSARIAAVQRLVPYIKLVERERLRPPLSSDAGGPARKTEAAYNEFYTSAETDRLFTELIGDKLLTSQIIGLLAQGPLATAEIAKRLTLSPSRVAKLMGNSSRQGLVTYDVQSRCYALA